MIKLRKKQKGFTLVELLIVIAIIAVLAAVVTPVAMNAINKSKATAVYAEMKTIESAYLAEFVTGTTVTNIGDLALNGIESGVSKNATYVLSINGDNKAELDITLTSDFMEELQEVVGVTSLDGHPISDVFVLGTVAE